MLQVIAHRLAKNASFDIMSLAHQVIRVVTMHDPLDILLNDRTLIQVAGDVVGRCANQFDAALVRLVIWFGALEAR